MIIVRSKERIRETNEVFTPLPLVDKILNGLPKEVWAPKKKFLDPACGDGNFLVRVVAYKIFYGSTPKQALETTYGVDIMGDNIVHCKERLLTYAFAADRNKKIDPDNILGHLTLEDERQFGQAKGRDAFARKYEEVVGKNIVCANTLEMNFDNSWPEQAPDPTNEVPPILKTTSPPKPTWKTKEEMQLDLFSYD